MVFAAAWFIDIDGESDVIDVVEVCDSQVGQLNLMIPLRLAFGIEVTG
jgi:hypothetical protein